MPSMNTNRDFTIVNVSPVHGKGLFAKKIIPKGTRIMEYAGKRVLKKNLITDLQLGSSSLVYIMNLSKAMVIDGERDGNNARYINHSCTPNCIVYFFNDIPYIYSLREISTGEELSFDYQLGIAKKQTKLSEQQKKELYPCFCGTTGCRKTMLSE